MGKFVDLHMHSTCSDGTKTVAELISMARQEGLKAISITDHDNVIAYQDLNLNNQGIEILKGVEIITTASKVPVEVLVYGFDVASMGDFLQKHSLNHKEESRLKTSKEMEVLKTYGIETDLDLDDFDYDDPNGWILRELWKKLMQDPKAVAFLNAENPELTEACSKFFRKGLGNIKSKLFVDLSNDYISMKKLREYCDENNLVMFLAHPGEYFDNIDLVLKEALLYVDGLEVYHPSVNKDLREYLIKIANEHNLMLSGGSDYHGFRGSLNSEKVPYHLYEKIVERLSVLAK